MPKAIPISISRTARTREEAIAMVRLDYWDVIENVLGHSNVTLTEALNSPARGSDGHWTVTWLIDPKEPS